MFLVGLISWWYGSGWRGQWRRIFDRWIRTAQFFSIGQLLATLFSPYRQISAETGGGSFSQAIRGFFDQLISRAIGGIVRTFTILAGIVVIFLQATVEILVVVFWLFLPLTSIAGAVLFALGWVPSW